MKEYNFTGTAINCGSLYSGRNVASQVVWRMAIDKIIADAGGVGKKHYCKDCRREIVGRPARAECCKPCLETRTRERDARRVAVKREERRAARGEAA